MTRNTQAEVIKMKQTVIEQTLAKEIKCKKGAELLSMHPKSFSRLRKNYKLYGIQALTPDKPGPKEGSPPPNRTPEIIEEIVCDLGMFNPFMGPIELAEKLFDDYTITLEQTTIYRILKRQRIRYNLDYTPIPKKEPRLYCLDYPGQELQLDASYPFGRSRPICCFSAIDDCSRYVFGLMCDQDNTRNAIRLIEKILGRSPFPIKRIRVDNRYGKLLGRYCESRGIELIENDAYAPTQNGKIERYHKTLKQRFFYAKCSFLDDTETLEYKLQLWIGYYNEKKKHTGLGMNKLTPREKIIKVYWQKLAEVETKKVTLTLQSYNT
jgi:transposase InsO family protein